MKDDILLELRANKQISSSRLKQKEKYRLARDLGFSSYEAVILQNWAEARIRALAESRQSKQ
jgi:hypothetical protein